MALSSAESSLSFATLTPESKVAQTHLASLVAKHRSDAVGSRLDLVAATRHLSNASPSDAHDAASRSKYAIIFTFSRRGHGGDSEWVVGKLDSNKHEQRVDMPVCSPRSRCIKGRKLFEVFIHPKSGVLMIRNANANHSLWYLNADNRGDHVELRATEEHVLHMSTNLLRIGSLHYALRYSIESASAFLASRKAYMQVQLGNWDIPSCFAIQPRHDHIRLRHVILHNVIAKGVTSVVRAGVDRKTGNPIASEFEDMHLVMPYAPFTFDTAPWQEISASLKLALFRHTLEGLKNLHATGIMHRDINPSNLLVFSLQPAAAAIGDFGMAKVGSQSAEKPLGSLAYQAPEVATHETYTNAIDIFSLALSIMATFEGCMWSGPLSDHENYSAMLDHLARLETQMPDGLATVLRAMLSQDSSQRPSAEDVLTDAVWEQIEEPGSVHILSLQSSEESFSMQRPDNDLPLPGSNVGDGLDRSLQSPIPELSTRSSNPSSNTSSADDSNQRMKRSDAPPPSSIGSDNANSTAETHGRDHSRERMSRSEAPSPSSAANDDN
ncbi:hypothetical protein MKX07_007149 [Trichoderma sp. CBMAI-0711]|nr:hypothetical protein MKX07_007149 [Trichoderma sp. CBMAI-0711]